jgi:catechol 2,3-dioxygenase-like lactoylglutathione lyase family enzyme
MTDKPFRVFQIDHVEFFVPNQYEAADWYRRILGLEIVAEFEDWAAGGPLMIATEDGHTKLALFEGQPRGDRPTAGFHRVAFGVAGDGFLHFLARLSQTEIHNRDGGRLTTDQTVDHGKSWSIYFKDPYGHLLEVTTYDYDQVSEALKQ